MPSDAQTPFVSYAQNFEDVMLWRALRHVEHGFYVDIGAQHPVTFSTSRAFYERGWRGVHVEPIAAYAELLRQDRPDETVLQVVVGEREELLTIHDIPDTGLSTLDPAIAERHERAGWSGRERTVPAVTLDAILGAYRGRDVHWLKIDVEGHEQPVLAGWTLRAPLPWIVVVESTSPMTKIDTSAQWEPMLLARGYRFAYFDGLNRFYVAKGHYALLEAFREPPNVFDNFRLTASSDFAQTLACEIVALKHGVAEQLRAAEQAARTASVQAEALGRQHDEARNREQQLAEQLHVTEQSTQAASDRAEALGRQHDEALNREERLSEQLHAVQQAAQTASDRAEALGRQHDEAHSREERLIEQLHAAQQTAQKACDQAEAVRRQNDEGAARLRDVSQALAASQGDVQQAREAGAVLAVQLESERAQGNRIEQTLLATEARIAALRHELARQQAAYEALTSRTVEQQRCFDALVNQLVDSHQSQDAVARELLSTQKRVGDLGTELTASHADVVYLRQAYTESERRAAHATRALAAMSAAYESIRGSRSWRLTAPLRSLFGAARRIGARLRDAFAGIASLPRRAAKRVLASALSHVRAHPRRKALVGRMLGRSNALNARLRRFARNHPERSIPGTHEPARAQIAAGTAPESATAGAKPAPAAMDVVPDSPSTGETRKALQDATRPWAYGRRLDG